MLLHSMMSNIYEGFKPFHTQVVDINSRIGIDDIKQKVIDLEHATQTMNSNLQVVASQVAQHQAGGPRQQ